MSTTTRPQLPVTSDQTMSSPTSLSRKERQAQRNLKKAASPETEDNEEHKEASDHENDHVDHLELEEGDIEDFEVPEEDLNNIDDKIKGMSEAIPELGVLEDDEESDPESGDEDDDENNNDHEPVRNTDSDDHPQMEDKDVDASILSEMEVVRGQVSSFQAQLSKKDEQIAKLEADIERLTLAVHASSGPSNVPSNIADIVGALSMDMKTLRAEMTQFSERRQDELQLSEQKLKKDLAKTAPAPIIATATDVPSAIVTPGTSPIAVASSSKVSQKKKKKAIRYSE